MAAPTIQVEGAREVRKALRAAGVRSRDMVAIHRQVGALVVPGAAARSRVKTGKLAGSYRVYASAARASVGSRLVYAPVQEFGWPARNITASEALQGAVEAARGRIIETYRGLVDDLVARYERGG